MKIELSLPDVILIREILRHAIEEVDNYDGVLSDGAYVLKEQTERIYQMFDDALPQKEWLENLGKHDNLEDYDELLELQEIGEELLETLDSGRIQTDEPNLSNDPKEASLTFDTEAVDKWDYADGYVGNPEEDNTLDAWNDVIMNSGKEESKDNDILSPDGN